MRRTLPKAALAACCLAASLPAVRPAAADIPARRAYDFVDSVGVCVHFGWRRSPYETAFDEVKKAIGDLGIRHLRQRPGSALTLRRLADIRDTYGIRLEATIDTAEGEEDFDNRRLAPDRIADFVQTAVDGLGADAFVGFEGPNEYDNTNKGGGNPGWAQDLRAYMAVLHRTVKGSSSISHVPVVSPSLAKNTVEMFQQVGDLSQVSERGNLHAYSGERPTGFVIDEFIRLAAITNPGDKVIVTEYGWTTAINRWQSHPYTPNAKAKYLARGMATFFSRPQIERAYIYQLVDDKPDPGLSVANLHMGLLDNDVQPTPSYYAVRNMMHLMCDADGSFEPAPLRASLSGGSETLRSFAVQKASGVYNLVLWQEVASYEKPKPRNAFRAMEISTPAQQATLRFDQPVALVRTYLPTALDGDPDGGRKPKQTFEAPGSVSLQVPDEVLIVEIIPDGVKPPPPPTKCDFVPRGR